MHSKSSRRQFVIGTKKGIMYSRLNPNSPGGGRNGEWYTDVAAVVLEAKPKNLDDAVMALQEKVLEDIMHASGIMHGRIVKTLTQVNDIWFVADDAFEYTIEKLVNC